MEIETEKGLTKVKATHWYMYRPVYLLLIASVLVCLQPVCMLIIGSWNCDGSFTSDQIDMSGGKKFPAGLVYNATTKTFTSDGVSTGHYLPDGTFKTIYTDLVTEKTNVVFPDGCSASMKNFFFDGGNSNFIVPNTTIGLVIQIFGTYLGFIFMFVGVCQATMLHVKVARKWAALRGGNTGTQA